MQYYLYILRNEYGNLYTGITTEPERRLDEHRRDPLKGAKYNRGRKELTLVFSCLIGNRSLASRAEYRVKRLRKKQKEQLVIKNPDKSLLLSMLGIAHDSNPLVGSKP
ncbi:MAG: GIY-YIG nuclease family protein [Desulfobulbaceae bacterium]|nr:MAG: GIY-YIG nuclease family protein [Desulfobulbaceae bacterium]